MTHPSSAQLYELLSQLRIQTGNAAHSATIAWWEGGSGNTTAVLEHLLPAIAELQLATETCAAIVEDLKHARKTGGAA